MPVAYTIRLPAEILDLICSFLDKHSLHACTLLSRNCRAFAHPHLFRSITIHDAGSQYNFNAFSEFLDTDASPISIRSIKEVKLKGRQTLHTLIIDVSDIGSLITRLPSLKCLHLTIVYMRISRMIPLPWSKRRAMSLLSLDRVGCAAGPDEPGVHCLLDPSQPTLCSLVELLDLFSSIRTLHFRNVTHAWKNVPRDTSRAGDLVRVEASKISENLRVERIISEKDIFLQDRRDAYALWMIGYSPIGRALQYLELSESVFLTIDFFPLFPSLQHLRLHLHEMQRVTPFDVRMSELMPGAFTHAYPHVQYDLSPFTKLDRMDIIAPSLGQMNLKDRISQLIRTLSRSPISTTQINAELRFQDPQYEAFPIPGDLQAVLDSVDNTLSSRVNLRKLTFIFTDALCEDKIQCRLDDGLLEELKTQIATIRTRLSQMQSKGLLRFRVNL